MDGARCDRERWRWVRADALLRVGARTSPGLESLHATPANHPDPDFRMRPPQGRPDRVYRVPRYALRGWDRMHLRHFTRLQSVSVSTSAVIGPIQGGIWTDTPRQFRVLVLMSIAIGRMSGRKAVVFDDTAVQQ